MMGNRKLPFGYQIKLGEVVVNPAEAKMVDDMFHWYIGGDSYSVLVKKLQEQPVRYSEGKPWNKNMVARILEDNAEKTIRKADASSEIISAEAPAAAQRMHCNRTDGTTGLGSAQWIGGSPGTNQRTYDQRGDIAGYSDSAEAGENYGAAAY